MKTKYTLVISVLVGIIMALVAPLYAANAAVEIPTAGPDGPWMWAESYDGATLLLATRDVTDTLPSEAILWDETNVVSETIALAWNSCEATDLCAAIPMDGWWTAIVDYDKSRSSRAPQIEVGPDGAFFKSNRIWFDGRGLQQYNRNTPQVSDVTVRVSFNDGQVIVMDNNCYPNINDDTYICLWDINQDLNITAKLMKVEVTSNYETLWLTPEVLQNWKLSYDNQTTIFEWLYTVMLPIVIK